MMAQFYSTSTLKCFGLFYTSIQWTNRIYYCFTALRYSSVAIYLKGSGDLWKSKKFENRSSLETSFINKIKANINKASNNIMLFYSSANSEAATSDPPMYYKHQNSPQISNWI